MKKGRSSCEIKMVRCGRALQRMLFVSEIAAKLPQFCRPLHKFTTGMKEYFKLTEYPASAYNMVIKENGGKADEESVVY